MPAIECQLLQTQGDSLLINTRTCRRKTCRQHPLLLKEHGQDDYRYNGEQPTADAHADSLSKQKGPKALEEGSQDQPHDFQDGTSSNETFEVPSIEQDDSRKTANRGEEELNRSNPSDGSCIYIRHESIDIVGLKYTERIRKAGVMSASAW